MVENSNLCVLQLSTKNTTDGVSCNDQPTLIFFCQREEDIAWAS
jgi:hypothetical protein